MFLSALEISCVEIGKNRVVEAVSSLFLDVRLSIDKAVGAAECRRPAMVEVASKSTLRGISGSTITEL